MRSRALIGADWLDLPGPRGPDRRLPARGCAHRGVRHLVLLRRVRHRRRHARIPGAAAARALGCRPRARVGRGAARSSWCAGAENSRRPGERAPPTRGASCCSACSRRPCRPSTAGAACARRSDPLPRTAPSRGPRCGWPQSARPPPPWRSGRTTRSARASGARWSSRAPDTSRQSSPRWPASRLSPVRIRFRTQSSLAAGQRLLEWVEALPPQVQPHVPDFRRRLQPRRSPHPGHDARGPGELHGPGAGLRHRDRRAQRAAHRPLGASRAASSPPGCAAVRRGRCSYRTCPATTPV